MSGDFVPPGNQAPAAIARKLREIGDEEAVID